MIISEQTLLYSGISREELIERRIEVESTAMEVADSVEHKEDFGDDWIGRFTQRMRKRWPDRVIEMNKVVDAYE